MKEKLRSQIEILRDLQPSLSAVQSEILENVLINLSDIYVELAKKDALDAADKL